MAGLVPDLARALPSTGQLFGGGVYDQVIANLIQGLVPEASAAPYQAIGQIFTGASYPLLRGTQERTTQEALQSLLPQTAPQPPEPVSPAPAPEPSPVSPPASPAPEVPPLLAPSYPGEFASLNLMRSLYG